MLTVGYVDLLSKNVTAYDTHLISGNNTYQATSGNFGTIPVELGFKHILEKALYFEIQGGLGFGVTISTYNQTEDSEFNEVKFLVSPEIGYCQKQWAIGLKYDAFLGDLTSSNNAGSYGTVSLHIAFKML